MQLNGMMPATKPGSALRVPDHGSGNFQSCKDWPYEFVRGLGSRYRGVFDSFEAAKRAASPSKPVGYNHKVASGIYVPNIGNMMSSDYPMLFWLGKLIQPQKAILDLGGNIGLSFYAYRKYLSFPADWHWVVFDVPEVITVGKEVAAARREQSEGLFFTGDFGDVNNCQILLASGSLQYLDQSLDSLLQSVNARPEHLFINRTPIYDGPSFVTLEDIGPVQCPYRIFNRKQLIAPLMDMGYELMDSWPVLELRCYVRYRTSRLVKNYTGLYLRLRV